MDQRYNEQRPSVVADAIAVNAGTTCRNAPAPRRRVLGSEPPPRRSDERFTVEGLIRFALHESVHHRQDAERAAGNN